MTILLVSNTRDLTTDLVVQELASTGQSFIRLNCDLLEASRPSFLFESKESSFIFLHRGEMIEAATIRAAYLRRPRLDGMIALHSRDAAHRYGEWRALLDALYSELNGRWLNEPHLSELAEDKVRQLRLAASMGFRIPRTLVSNDPLRIARFSSRFACVAKPLRDGILRSGDGEEVIFTNRLTAPPTADDPSILASPIIVQEEIAKTADVRVTVVGSEAFATLIFSQADEGAMVDWRRGDVARMEHAIHDLPSAEAARCIAYVKRLGLRFGAIDLILDRDGDYWFLENNPNGQWGWIQLRTGQAISRAIVGNLMEIAVR